MYCPKCGRKVYSFNCEACNYNYTMPVIAFREYGLSGRIDKKALYYEWKKLYKENPLQEAGIKGESRSKFSGNNTGETKREKQFGKSSEINEIMGLLESRESLLEERRQFPDFRQLTQAGDSKERKATQNESFNNKVRNVGPNDPCPCGSGKKYKLCHGKKQDNSAAVRFYLQGNPEIMNKDRLHYEKSVFSTKVIISSLNMTYKPFWR